MLAYTFGIFWFDWPLLALTAILFVSFFLSIRQRVRGLRWYGRRIRLQQARKNRVAEDFYWRYYRHAELKTAMELTAARSRRQLLTLLADVERERQAHPALKVVS